jgi:hypothetical protein
MILVIYRGAVSFAVAIPVKGKATSGRRAVTERGAHSVIHQSAIQRAIPSIMGAFG